MRRHINGAVSVRLVRIGRSPAHRCEDAHGVRGYWREDEDIGLLIFLTDMIEEHLSEPLTPMLREDADVGEITNQIDHSKGEDFRVVALAIYKEP